ncbi:EAL domain-containing protein [Pseudoalteromonas sp.]|uniref:EAL domain-containing response regulator n=1 Tax=Pseudoalteromonas sp. TaxID=53249 RepID=UPI0035656C76
MKPRVPNILVIDDSRAILIIMEAILCELDMSDTITTCLTAGEALEKVTADINYYDAIFTDLNMPEMDGMELIRHLGELHYQGAIIIISEMDPKVISLAASIAKQHNVHLIGNLSKPVQLNQVNALLNKIVSLNSHTLHKEPIISKQALIQALLDDEITPFYQPKICIASCTIKSAEILARIVSSEDGSIILPNRFIALAEQHELIDQITFTLFEKATSDFKYIQELLGNDIKLALNLSPTQLDNLDCPNKLLLILELNQIKPSDIIIEITEQNALASLAQLETLNRLRMHGFGLSLDDFGIGFTNMSQLKNLPFTEIKIDRTFISHIDTDQFSQVVVSSLIDISNQEHLELVAEGVERPEELAYLKNYHTKLAIQGFLFSQPKSNHDFIDWAKYWLKTSSTIINNKPPYE